MALSRGMSCACMRVLLLVALVVGALGIMQVRGLPAQAGSKGGGQEMQAADAVQGGGGGIKENSEEGTFVSSASSTQDSESGKKERKNRFHSKQVDQVGYGDQGPGAETKKQSARDYIKYYIDAIDKHYIQNCVSCWFCDDATYSMLMPVVDEYANPPYAWKETRLSGVESITNYMCQQPYLNRKTVGKTRVSVLSRTLYVSEFFCLKLWFYAFSRDCCCVCVLRSTTLCRTSKLKRGTSVFPLKVPWIFAFIATAVVEQLSALLFYLWADILAGGKC
eukprot:GHVS01090378.1.p1 GENE.GHVS01090378.1~~GHVS01090378.1.p1  ORF type:complete len:278 (+),score=33.42 GHVS01090378.1:170-1003(+)